MNFNKTLRKNLVNIPGWRSNRKIVVIESDDWGSIRMPSLQVYEFLLSKGIFVDKSYFTKYDCIESNDDLEALFEALETFKDRNGAHPVITANSVVANPNFNKIKATESKEYIYEPIIETYKKYPNHNNVMELWKKQGIEKKMLYPQFHGREHLNARKWIEAINSDIEQEKVAFENNVLLGLGLDGDNLRKYRYMAAFEYESERDKRYIEEMTIDGLNLFEEIFGFRSISFAPSQSIQGNHINPILAENGVKFHQLGQQFIPISDGKLKVKNRFWGSENEYGQKYWRRNCTFEPSRNQDFDWVNSCLAEIEIAFRWGKPAVINSHRVNYIGSIFPENREQSLIKLKLLLQNILKLWPDVEFKSSEDLGKIIDSKNEY